ncbi:phosphoglycolate phosphatase [Leptothrix discophora]|uniref:phosphoglycolate phosphatase n=1 Tax=Leptothrix discophora TaxID=89 RepID=A0ABT9G810_LEPDI|nr:phosphoglycolate phosphatase [Leptothrix discophora]MDP4302550.1 phosphoglycolate phosphatase [Leptothrix discophora]
MSQPEWMPDAVTFDLDGTLVDTAGEIAAAVNATLAEFDVEARPQAEITALIGDGLRALMLRLMAQLLLARPSLAERLQPDAALASLERHYALRVGASARAYPGAASTLQALRAAGVPTGCVTNKDGRHARMLLEATGLIEHLDLVIAGDTLPQRKPHPSVLRSAAARLGVAPHRLAHVGDSRTDLQAARNAGAADWAVPHGYNGGEPIEAAAPGRLFDDLGAVAAHVLALRGHRLAA